MVLQYGYMAGAAPKSKRRSYEQYCAVAYGLDVIGERWTLLIVRDLLLGPKRYKDLLEGLPGIGTNLLADRLHEMERVGLVERTVLPPPAGSTVYQLTEAGQGLEPALIALGRWGARFLKPEPKKTDVLVPRAYFVAVRAAFKPELAAGLRETYEFRIGQLGVFEVRIEDGRCFSAERQASHPDAVFSMSVETLNALVFQVLKPEEAIATGKVDVKGDPEALERFIKLCAFRPLPPSKAAMVTARIGNKKLAARG